MKWKTGADVRAAGSGNIGATNVLRTTGRAAGVATLLLDIAKGYAAVWMAGRLTGQDVLWMSLAALAVMAGHAYPVFLGFKGGKAVASFVGAFLCLTPWALGCGNYYICSCSDLDAAHFHGLDYRGGHASAGRLAGSAGSVACGGRLGGGRGVCYLQT